MKVERSQRSLLRNYGEQIDALGAWRWLRFKLVRARSRFAPSGQQFTVVTPLAEHPLVFRSDTSDTNVFSQIFIHREYRCLDEVRHAGLVVDCGANVGYSSAFFLSRFPEAHVIAIEPDPDNFEVLRTNVRPYGSRCTPLRAAVWSSSDGLVQSPRQAGTRQEWAVKVRPAEGGEEPTVASIDLPSLLRDSGYDRISILKIDIEGSERDVFASDTGWLDRVDNLVIELHGAACRQVFMAAIDGRGFDVTTCEELTVCTRSAT